MLPDETSGVRRGVRRQDHVRRKRARRGGRRRQLREGRRVDRPDRPRGKSGDQPVGNRDGGGAPAGRGRAKGDIAPFFLPLLLAGRLGDFCDRYPELSVEFISTEHLGDLVSEGIDLAIRFQQPRLSTLVARKLVEAPILTLASPRYLERYGKPEHPSDLAHHRCLQFLDPYTGRPFEWEFVREGEAIEVPTSGPLHFADPQPIVE